MDDRELKNKLIGLGMESIDAELLIKISKNQRTSVSKVFFKSLAGLYLGTFVLIGGYFTFMTGMNREEIIVFSSMYIPVIILIYFFTPSLKKFLWSLKVLFSLKGR